MFTGGTEDFAGLEIDGDPVDIFPSGEGVFILTGGNELYRHSGDHLEKTAIPSGIEHLSDILLLESKNLFIDGENNRILVITDREQPVERPHTEAFLEDFGYSCAMGLSTGHIAIGTLNGGLLILSEDGRVLKRISMTSGIYSDRISGIFVDASDNLWVLHEHAISRIEIPSAFSLYFAANGLEGNIKDLLRQNGILYASGSRGLFRLRPGDEKEFIELEADRRLEGIERMAFRVTDPERSEKHFWFLVDWLLSVRQFEATQGMMSHALERVMSVLQSSGEPAGRI